MPLGLGIVDVLRAIPPRIEVAGHGPTIRITAGSFDAALDYARERLAAPAVLDCAVRNRLWPRVSISVTTDPVKARSAPPLDEVRARAEHQLAALRDRRAPEPHESTRLQARADLDPPDELSDPGGPGLWTLEQIFADQERRRQVRGRIPTQRGTGD